MSEVQFCEDLHLQRHVVLKRLQPGIEARRLLDEQKALSKVRSKHVVQLYDIVTILEHGTEYPAIVLEFIDGNTLEIGKFLPDLSYLNLIWQIACGLNDIHEHGIIHRDIKPGNIKIDGEGVVKILDFGLSRSNADAKTRSIIGTPLFMAPEQWGHQSITFDSSIDVYAYAITCLALLTNEIPISLTKHPPSQPSWDSFSAPFAGIPKQIIDILYQCLATRNDRPAMQDVKNLLARQLLKNRHRATVVLNGTTNTLDCNNRTIALNAKIGNLTIEYDGIDFKVTKVSGAVYINNTAVFVGAVVPGCCVLTFGDSGPRTFVTFDISNPEVMP
ncbi:MAG: serine/threonine protein kinase [Achromobacter sp.]|nr:serine/threonine protein kinase [Achromobacter sp.]